MDRKDQIKKLQKEWDSNSRWKNVRRDYSAEDVVRLRGSFIPEYSLATKGANKLWDLVNGKAKKGYVNSLGALTAGQALQQVKAGIEAIYLSGRNPALFTKFLDSVIEFADIAAIGTVLLVEESPTAINSSFSFSPHRSAVTFLQCSIEKLSSITIVCERTNSRGRRTSTIGFFVDKAAA